MGVRWVQYVCVCKQLKEQEIKRQFQDAAKIQQKQFKVYRTHQLAKTSKAEQKDLMKRMKEEQLRRMAMLSQQYDASIAEMIERQNVSNQSSWLVFVWQLYWDDCFELVSNIIKICNLQYWKCLKLSVLIL